MSQVNLTLKKIHPRMLGVKSGGEISKEDKEAFFNNPSKEKL
jgi:hypothetical protein